MTLVAASVTHDRIVDLVVSEPYAQHVYNVRMYRLDYSSCGGAFTALWLPRLSVFAQQRRVGCYIRFELEASEVGGDE